VNAHPRGLVHMHAGMRGGLVVGGCGYGCGEGCGWGCMSTCVCLCAEEDVDGGVYLGVCARGVGSWQGLT